jgi:4-diphosphocytidyl-2-C-methyl-D-erythritol kinase
MRIARNESGISGVTIFAPAKLNLFLEVLAKRPDGYHDLETLMVAIDWCDTLRLSARDDDRLRFTARWAIQGAYHCGDLPLGAENIVVRALEKMRQVAGVARGANMELIKRIPSAAGLGGASSDAAAAIAGANILWDLKWSPQKLADIAADLGSDIPFFLGAPVAVCRGRGEIIEPLDGLPPLDVVVVRPPEGLSTPAVYKRCHPADRPASSAPLLAAWRRGDFAGVGRALTNRLEEPAARLSPWIGRLRESFAREPCYGYQMSGSGSSYFGICKSAAHARRVAARFRSGGICFAMAARTMTVAKVSGASRAA